MQQKSLSIRCHGSPKNGGHAPFSYPSDGLKPPDGTSREWMILQVTGPSQYHILGYIYSIDTPFIYIFYFHQLPMFDGWISIFIG